MSGFSEGTICFAMEVDLQVIIFQEVLSFWGGVAGDNYQLSAPFWWESLRPPAIETVQM